jgi:type IV fimbrial biogenesis protein FimT
MPRDGVTTNARSPARTEATQMRPTRISGVTMIELMAVIAVLIVLVLIAVPSFSDFFDRHRVRGAAEDIASMISDARAEAVKNDLDVSIVANGSGTAWCIGGNAASAPTGGNPAGAAADCDCSDAAQCRISGQRFAVDSTDHRGVVIGALPASLTFNSTMGVIVPLGARNFLLTSESGKYEVTVEVNALGQARACTALDKPTMTGVGVCTN